MADHQESRNLKDESCLDVAHDWAETAVKNIQNIAGCLTWQGKDADQLAFLSEFVGDVLDSFVALKNQKNPFEFNYFSHAISEPVRVFGFDNSPASYHAVAEDLICSLVPALFPRMTDPSKITEQVRNVIERQDFEILSAADVKRVDAALSDVTGHELKDTQERLRRLASGLAKEYERLGGEPSPPKRKEASDTQNYIRAATTNDARDKWIFEQCCALILTYKQILLKLSQLCKENGWENLGSTQALKQAANRYAYRHGLPEGIPRRQAGRRPSKK